MAVAAASCQTRTALPAQPVCRVLSSSACFRRGPVQQRLKTCVVRRPALRQSRQKCCHVFALGHYEGETAEGVEPGTKIKVTKEVLVYHAPKMPDLNLEGYEGTVKQIVKFFKDKELSANLPYKTEFLIPREGEKDLKLLVHLDSSEFEALT